MDILIIDCTKTDYDGVRAALGPIGGTETDVWDLSRTFAARGHNVVVGNATTRRVEAEGVHWIHRTEIGDRRADVVVLNNDADLFELARPALSAGALPVLWHHNPFKWSSRILRKGVLPAFFRYRPAGVFLGAIHEATFPRFLPYRHRCVIGLGLPAVFRTIEPPRSAPPRRAIYTSQAYRGLADMIGIWKSRIRPAIPDAEFHAHVGTSPAGFDADELRKHGIVLRERLPKDALAQAMSTARLMIYPGHKEEAFCVSAAESICVGTPIVTRGIGMLPERVRDGIDGFVAPGDEDFAARAISVLTDDALWQRLHDAALSLRPAFDWQNIAAQWENLFAALGAPLTADNAIEIGEELLSA